MLDLSKAIFLESYLSEGVKGLACADKVTILSIYEVEREFGENALALADRVGKSSWFGQIGLCT